MKNIIYLFMAITITLISCNNDENSNFMAPNSNISELNFASKNFKIEAVGVPHAEASLINCIPNELTEAILKDGFSISGNLDHLFGVNFMNGTLTISSCNVNSEKKEITTSYYGTFVDDEGDILNYNGEFIISYNDNSLSIQQNQNLRGVLDITDGSGKYQFVKAEVINLVGSIDFVTGKKYITGEGYVNFNNRYDY